MCELAATKANFSFNVPNETNISQMSVVKVVQNFLIDFVHTNNGRMNLTNTYMHGQAF